MRVTYVPLYLTKTFDRPKDRQPEDPMEGRVVVAGFRKIANRCFVILWTEKQTKTGK